YWHRGRCLAYGEGVTYWALAEMVRGRAGIQEREDPESAAAKLSATLDEFVTDPEEREWVEPRLAHLLGLEERVATEPEEQVSEAILERAAGIPLYAVETVRMLLDRGLLVQEGAAYRVTGPIEDLQVPETLHALIAARVDGLTIDERRAVQDGAVLGKSFTKEALASITGFVDEDLELVLAGLVRKEVLSVQADPRSPERGRY